MDELIVTSSGFKPGGLIPIEYTGYGADISPELSLHELSNDAVSIAIIMNDKGHPIPAFNHWVIWNIPAASVIPGNIPHGKQVDALGGAVQGLGYGKHRYRGPKPPFRASHVYRFHVFVLDCFLDLSGASTKKGLTKAMKGHILQQAILEGHYR